MSNLSEHYTKAAERAAYDARMQRLGGEVNEKVAQFYDESSKMYAAQAASAALEENRRAFEAQKMELERQRRELEKRQKDLEREAYQRESKVSRIEDAREIVDLEYRDFHKSYDDEIFSSDCLKIMIGTAMCIIAPALFFMFF